MASWVRLIPSMFFDKDFAPVRCTSCGCKDFRQDIRDMLDPTYGPITEYNEHCDDCGQFAQEWAYGYYNPAATESEPWGSIFRRLTND